MITISLCMIVKNEEAVLARCLDSMKDLMDEIIIIDTGSTDCTKQIARNYTDQIYDFTWCDDFSAARNFSFSKASMEYIYVADADEVLSSANQKQFQFLKEAMLPEVEMVQMKYVTKTDYNTVLNCQEEYRPKLYKRLREFCWIDPIHETVRTNPVVFDSDIAIFHMPEKLHSSRDFHVFQKTFELHGCLSKKLHTMYARELFISGTDADFMTAFAIFNATLLVSESADDMQKEASCILAHFFRIQNDSNNFFKLALKDMLTTPCAELCYELGEWYYAVKDYNEAVMWFYNAAFETTSILSIHHSGDLPLLRLSDCYHQLALDCMDVHLKNSYLDSFANYQEQYQLWELPKDF